MSITYQDHRPRTSAGPRTGGGRPHPSRLADAAALNAVAGLLAVSGGEIGEARGLLTLLGDPLRRVVLEQMARRPCNTSLLAVMTGAGSQDIGHRIRGLAKAGAVAPARNGFYFADPRPADCVRKYLDVLLTMTAYTQGAGAGGE
ncbi:MAG: hypothetical protein ABI906_02735 [Pseudomonadota bacterium]